MHLSFYALQSYKENGKKWGKKSVGWEIFVVCYIQEKVSEKLTIFKVRKSVKC